MTWDRLGGRKFVALLCSFLAYVVAVVGIFLAATVMPNLDHGSLIAAAAIITGGATLYAGFNVAQEFAHRPQVVQPPVPTVQVDTVQVDQPASTFTGRSVDDV